MYLIWCLRSDLTLGRTVHFNGSARNAPLSTIKTVSLHWSSLQGPWYEVVVVIMAQNGAPLSTIQNSLCADLFCKTPAWSTCDKCEILHCSYVHLENNACTYTTYARTPTQGSGRGRGQGYVSRWRYVDKHTSVLCRRYRSVSPFFTIPKTTLQQMTYLSWSESITNGKF